MTAGVLPGQPPSLLERRERAAELYRQGLSLREVAERVGVSDSTVQHDLKLLKVPIRPAGHPAPRYRQARTVFLPPSGVAIAFTGDRGWHLTAAPPAWFLDLLAEQV